MNMLTDIQIVPSYSAVIQGQRNVEDGPLDADHRSMTKFGSVDNENYKSVISVLRRLVDKAKQYPDSEDARRERELWRLHITMQMEAIVSTLFTFSPPAREWF